MRWWWRKKQDGFEWREYVRTTILVRRNERRQKVEDAKQAAIFGVKQAGSKGAEAGAAGLEAAGMAGKAAAGALGRGGAAVGAAIGRGGASLGRVVGHGALDAGSAIGRGAAKAGRASYAGLRAGGAAAGRASAAGYRRFRTAAAPYAAAARDRALVRLEPGIQTLLRPSIAMPLTIVALVVGVGALFRWFTIGLDTDVMFAAVVAVVSGALALLPRLAVGDVPRPLAAMGNMAGRVTRGAGSAFGGLGRPAIAAGLAAVIVLGGAAWWFTTEPAPGQGHATRQTAAVSNKGENDVPTVAVTRLPDLRGRGSALGGDLIKISGTTVKLSGIEAPERDQRCGLGDGERGWRCGQAAQDALARMLRSQQLVCQPGSTDDSGYRLATCSAGGKDIAAELVRGGHVFASAGFFARYGGAESEARAAKTGVWRSDPVERPSEYRSKRWEEAKAQAPQGCPIKGVARGSRTYVLPWSAGYERLRIRESRGDRWFCSEQEARAAGWRPTAL
jgi:endonuclease YncB( thermonuclease family)